MVIDVWVAGLGTQMHVKSTVLVNWADRRLGRRSVQRRRV